MEILRQILEMILLLLKPKSKFSGIEFKSLREEKEWQELGNQCIELKHMILDTSMYAKQQFGKNVVITCIKRTMAEQIAIYGERKESVHLYWRGVDLRSWTFTGVEICDIVEYVNKRYIYDPQRPELKCCIYHATKSGAYHLHFQIHDRTKKIKV